MTSRFTEDRGASAILLAFALVFLMGMAALAIDLGAAYNERRQSQTAADLAVMAGAMEITLGGTQQDIVNEALSYARVNLDAEYTDEEWRIAWQTCQDPERLNFDVGIGTPVDFQPIQEPAAWGSGNLECISQVSSYFRVRIPDQLVETAFAKIIGIDQVATNADAVAKLESEPAQTAVLPFGIPGGTQAGEVCLRSSPSGTAILPCQGPTGGAFGTINSEFFGDYFPPADCGLPGHDELEQNIAIGIDHAVAEWPSEDAGDEGVTDGSLHPGDNVVRDYQNIGFDRCDLDGGTVVPEDAGHITPPNTMREDTGFSPDAVQDGLVQYDDGRYFGENSRLQQGSNRTRTIFDNGDALLLDNKGLWDYLVNDSTVSGPSFGADACDGGKYGGLDLEEKVARMHDCLRGWEATNGAGTEEDIFVDDIDESPRFVWSPKYWHASAGTGTSWQPIQEFKLIFIGGTYFECNGGGCDIIFYPDAETTDDMCDSNGCDKKISIEQVTGFVIPTGAVPVDSVPPYPGAATDFVPTLFK
jgi:hypothetical protein